MDASKMFITLILCLAIKNVSCQRISASISASANLSPGFNLFPFFTIEDAMQAVGNATINASNNFNNEAEKLDNQLQDLYNSSVSSIEADISPQISDALQFINDSIHEAGYIPATVIQCFEEYEANTTILETLTQHALNTAATCITKKINAGLQIVDNIRQNGAEMVNLIQVLEQRLQECRQYQYRFFIYESCKVNAVTYVSIQFGRLGADMSRNVAAGGIFVSTFKADMVACAGYTALETMNKGNEITQQIIDCINTNL